MAQQILHSLEELAQVQLGFSTPQQVTAWANALDRSELAQIKRLARVVKTLTRNGIRFHFTDEWEFRISRYRKGSDVPMYGYLRVYAGEYAFGTEELDYNFSSRLSDVVYAVKMWLGGASFSDIETEE